jgi:hypothetical protein
MAVRVAVFPDPLSQRPIRLRDATATIREYTKATGDVAGTIDLMLEFVEAGTEQAADLGYGDDAYFTALERKVNEIVRLLDQLPNGERRAPTERLARLGAYQSTIGWAMATFSRTWQRNCELVSARVVQELDVRSEGRYGWVRRRTKP